MISFQDLVIKAQSFEKPSIYIRRNVNETTVEEKEESLLPLATSTTRTPDADAATMARTKQARKKNKGFMGTYLKKHSNRFEAQFRMHNKPRSIGTFDTGIEAAIAYDVFVVWHIINDRPPTHRRSLNFNWSTYEEYICYIRFIPDEETLVKLSKKSGNQKIRLTEYLKRFYAQFYAQIKNVAS